MPTFIVHFFKVVIGGDFFINNLYLKSSHRLKSISGTIIIIVNFNNFDFIAILLLAGGFEGNKTVHRQDNSPTRFLKTVHQHI